MAESTESDINPEIKRKHDLARDALDYCTEMRRSHRLEDFELTRYHRDIGREVWGVDYQDECYWCGYQLKRRYFEDAEAVLRNKDRNFSLRELED